MNVRIWDPKGIYKDAFLKEYNHWVVELSFRQHTLGCFIIFAKRRVEKISELNEEEIVELKDVMKEMEITLSQIDAFRPDRFNYLQLGNALHHLHFHGIPRYKTPRTFNNQIWSDKTFGHPPVWTKKSVDKEIVIKIKELILQQLSL